LNVFRATPEKWILELEEELSGGLIDKTRKSYRGLVFLTMKITTMITKAAAAPASA